MDPPAWGIGASGEKWKLEDKIDELMMTASSLLEDDGVSHYILVNREGFKCSVAVLLMLLH